MAKHQDVPDPTTWWTGRDRLLGSPEAGVVAAVDSDGVLHGPMTVFKDGVPILESHWRAGSLHGQQVVWKAPFFRVATFEDGVPHGLWRLYWNEHPLVEITFDGGAVASSKRHNELQVNTAGKESYFIDDKRVKDRATFLKRAKKAHSIGIAGWREAALPEELWALDKVKKFQLYTSDVRPIPSGIGNMKNLEVLDIKGCNIGWIDAAIGKLDKLKVMQIVDSGLGAFPAVTSPVLQTVDVSGNTMVRIGHDLGQLPALSMLKMRNNYLFALDEAVFAAPKLSMLDLTGSTWVGWISPEVKRARNLVNLTLYEQTLQALPPELGTLPKLQTLNLYGAYLASPGDLGRRTISGLNLGETPLRTLFPTYEDDLQQLWAQEDEHLAAHRAREALTFEDVGGKAVEASSEDTPLAAASSEASDAAFEALRALAKDTTSGDFGCENGDHAVNAYPLAADAPHAWVRLLIERGVLHPCDAKTFDTLAMQDQTASLRERLSASAPVTPWLLEALPGREEDLKVACLVQQLNDEVWAVIGPDLQKRFLRPTPADPFQLPDPRLADFLRRELSKGGGGALWYQGLERRPGGPTKVSFGSSHAAAMAAYLRDAGAVRVTDAATSEVAILQHLGPHQAVAVAAVALSTKLWLGKGLAVATQLVET